MVVDDDPDTTDSIRDTLRRRGFDAHGFYSADECLAWLKTRDAAVVISDVRMPGTTGIELATRLREEHPALRVIILTGAGGLDIAIEAIRAGAFDYISKPVEGDALSLAVSRALDWLLRMDWRGEGETALAH